MNQKEGTFQRVEKTAEKMYGPRKLLVCGYLAKEQEALVTCVKETDLNDLPVVFIGENEGDKLISEILAWDDGHGAGEDSSLGRAVIMSGFFQEELHRLMKNYRESGMPSQLWATVTPISEGWRLIDLLKELAVEAEAMRKRASSKR